MGVVKLREYQEELISRIRQEISRGSKRILCTSPTGSGKTVIFSKIAHGAHEKGKSLWVLVHRRELIDQTGLALESHGLEYGIVSAEYDADYDKKLQICSVQSLARRIDKLGVPDIIVIDECHHAVSQSYKKTLEAFPDAVKLGFTATAERLDGRGLGEIFDTIVEGPQVRWLIDNGYLSKYSLWSIPTTGKEVFKRRGNDYDMEQAAKVMDKGGIMGDVVKTYKEICNDSQAIVFCCNIRHAQETAEAFSACGYSAASIDGKMNRQLRQQIIGKFRLGKIQVLTNVSIVSEGFDVPEIESVIFLRPTQSLAVYLQALGRVLRVPPDRKDKVAKIIDHVGNFQRHGIPCKHREWVLEGRRKRERSEESGPVVKTCPVCFRMQVLVLGKGCKFCGSAFNLRDMGVKEFGGELYEIDTKKAKELEKKEKELIKRAGRFEVSTAGSIEQLREIEKKRGYKEGWAEHIWGARLKKKCVQ